MSATPPYCHRSAPIEIVWANIKNPIGRATSAETVNDLMRKIQDSKDKVEETAMLGAYADTRQWEDEMWLADPRVADGEMPEEPDDDEIIDDDNDAEEVEAEENSE